MRTDYERVEPAIQALLRRIAGAVSELPGADKLVLYGSYAKGTHSPESDVDLAVFFRDSANPPLIEEYRRLARICATPDYDIQVQAFALSELESPCGIVEEIDMYGVELPLGHEKGFPAERGTAGAESPGRRRKSGAPD